MTGVLIYNLGYLLLIPKYTCTRIVDGKNVTIPYKEDDDSDYQKYCLPTY